MPRYRADEHQPYFCTITVLDWLPVLIESRYIDPIINSLQFCRQHKGLQLFAFVIMPNHVHLIAGADVDLHRVMRDFKCFTSRAIHELLKEDQRATILQLLYDATRRSREAGDELGLWQEGFHPQELSSLAVFEQKLRYLHENPVRKRLVVAPQDWWYSSARCYAGWQDVCTQVDAPEW